MKNEALWGTIRIGTAEPPKNHLRGHVRRDKCNVADDKQAVSVNLAMSISGQRKPVIGAVTERLMFKLTRLTRRRSN